MSQVFSIGHSTLSYDAFLARLRKEHITAIADVRTSPFSKNFPQYNRDVLKESLARDGIAYVFLGRELGGRPERHEYYTDGVADYEKMASADAFSSGLDRVEQGAAKYRVALMCSEGNPLECHRCLLVGRALQARGINVSHILPTEELVSHQRIEEQLLLLAGKDHEDMFASSQQRLNDAYREQARKVAFQERPSEYDLTKHRRQ